METIKSEKTLDIDLNFKEVPGEGFKCYLPIFPIPQNEDKKDSMIGYGQTLEEAEQDFIKKFEASSELNELQFREEHGTDQAMGIDIDDSVLEDHQEEKMKGMKITSLLIQIELNFKRKLFISKETMKRYKETPDLKEYFLKFIHGKFGEY